MWKEIINMKSISIDLDGTTWDAHRPFLKIYNNKYNKELTINDITKWGHFPDEEFWPTYEESSKYIMEYNIFDFVKTNLLMIKGMFSISFVTHGMYNVVDIEKKLGKHAIYPDQIYDKIIIDDRLRKKARLDFDYFIDDNPHMVADICNYPKKTLLLFDQPWNRDIEVKYTLYGNVVRVKSWDDIGFYFLNKIFERFINVKKI